MPGEYTIAAALAVVAVVGLELAVLRTGLLREARFWGTSAIALSFQILVDGWLTRGDATVVYYNDAEASGIRWPWDIPVEDFGFGFALITSALLLWKRLGTRTDNA